MPRNEKAKATTLLKVLVLTLLNSWATGYLGRCHLSGKHLWLTTYAAQRATALDAIALVAEGWSAEDAADEAARRHTADVDGAHTPTASARGGHIIVLTDGPSQRAFGDEDTPDAPEDAIRWDDRNTAGFAAARALLAATRKALGG